MYFTPLPNALRYSNVWVVACFSLRLLADGGKKPTLSARQARGVERELELTTTGRAQGAYM